MASAQVNGDPLTSTQYGTFLQANNSNGTMKGNLNNAWIVNTYVVSSALSTISTVRPVVFDANSKEVFASAPVDGDLTEKDYAQRSVSAGTFAHNHVKPISCLITDSNGNSELAGLVNNAIRSTGNDQDTVRSINKLEAVQTRRWTSAVRANKWNRYTGKFDAGYPVNVTDQFWDIDGNTLSPTSTDNAASPSREVPGELTYMQGGVVPKMDTYKNNGVG